MKETNSKSMTYTSYEQSKRLMELGLNPESADLCWMDDKIPELFEPYNSILKQFNLNRKDFVFLPCWSAECLLNLLPDVIKTGNEAKNWYWININKNPYQISYGNDLGLSGSWHDMVSSSQSDALIDAVYSITEWLLEKANNKEFPFDNDLNNELYGILSGTTEKEIV